MNTFSFIPLGIGDAFSARWYSCCLALEADDTWMLIDCPHPIRKLIKDGGESAGVPDLDIDRISFIALSHLHADHSSGLEGFAFYSYYVLNRRTHLICHPVVSERLWENSLSAGMDEVDDPEQNGRIKVGLDFYFDVTTLSYERAAQVGPFSIECRRTLHQIPTTAFRISVGEHMLGYSADTSFDTSLIEWLAPADIIIHESNHGVHTRYDKLLTVDQQVRKRIRLIHTPDNFDHENSEITALRQGERYTVG